MSGLIILINVNLFAQKTSDNKNIQKELIGVWQASPIVASGMDNNFQFFADGNYKFNYNEMDGTKRILSYSGKWNISKGKLAITIEKVTFLTGGKWVEATGSTATDHEIEGGTVLEKNITPIEKQELSLSKFTKEELHNTTKIDGIKYWKLSSDPKTYEN